MKTHATDRFFAFILESLIGKFHPVVVFFVFVCIYFLFVFLVYGYDRRKKLIEEIRQMSWVQKVFIFAKTFVGIYVAYFIFYRLMIMTAMLDYPLPASIQIIGQSTISFLESVGFLK
jgi:uncharacterized membrane protein